MQIVETNALTKNFGSYKAVNNLNLTLKEGSITAFIGPNGAGKTTTLKMILGLLKPTSGTISVFGQNPWDNQKIRPQIGVVHEKAFFPSHQKTREYLERVCRIFGQPESKAVDSLKCVDLENAQNKQIKALSAGMLQKFCVAHALINDPEFIVADEMTANLDPQARKSLLDLVLKLNHDKHTTFLMSSHILPELSRVCDSVIILNQGKVLAQGNLNDILKENKKQFVKVSTDKPVDLANELKKLSYVQSTSLDLKGVIIQTSGSESENQLYEDTLKMAKTINAKILGIESGNTSIEELYNQIVGNSQEKAA